jgi:pimeloyl-ACP methyl ester carboxylesterase
VRANHRSTTIPFGAEASNDAPEFARSIRRHSFTSLFFLGAHMSAISLSQASPDKQPTTGVHNIVLVHGAWGDALNWSKVIPLLEAKGLHVAAVQNPLTSLADDVAATKRLIDLQEGPVLLVGHSYGGAVITEAGNHARVVGLVYVAAFAPDDNQAAGDLGKEFTTPPGIGELRPDAFGYLSLTPKGVAEDFGPDLSMAEKRMIIATQHPTNGAALGGKVSKAAWKSKPSWYLIAKNDRMISPQLQVVMAEQINATTITVDSSHLAMLAKPAEVANLIATAAMTGAAMAKVQ